MCVGEFGLTMDYTNEMTWAEFRIRLFAWNRGQDREWFKLREIAWASLIGSHVNPKKLPKSKERFMPLKKKKKTSESMIKRIKEAQEQFYKDKQKLENG